jgi:hypothetical protein
VIAGCDAALHFPAGRQIVTAALTIFLGLAARISSDRRCVETGEFRMRYAILGIVGCALMATSAHAQENVSLQSSVFVERTGHGSDGRSTRQIEPAGELSRGDRVVLLLEWRTNDRMDGFSVTAPIPRTLSYRRSGHEAELVSVDGGRSWGELGDLRIRDDGDIRLAAAADVTHVRWRISRSEAAQGSGRIAYSAVVR